ncbi:MAG TPA: hypothetical protein VGB23_06935 [Nitrospirota bacterium]
MRRMLLACFLCSMTALMLAGCGAKTLVVPGDRVIRFVPEKHCQPCHASFYDGYGLAGPAWYRERYRTEIELLESLKECEDR